MKLYIFIQQTNHTLVATWSGSTPNVTKTITGCVVGQPIILIYNTTDWDKASNINDVLRGDYNYTYVKIKSGANPQYGWTTLGFVNYWQHLTDSGAHAEELNMILIPTATTVTIELGKEHDGDDIIYVYKQ